MADIRCAGVKPAAVAFWMLCGLCGQALATDAASSPATGLQAPAEPSEQLFDFHLPAQPLPGALNQFAQITGRSALFPSTLVTTPFSAPVSGRYTARAALHLLLEGTGLDVQEINADSTTALVLTPVSPQPVTVADAAPARWDPLLGYDKRVQQRVWEAICRNPVTARSGYRTVLRFRIDPAGRLRRAHLLRPTGNARRDAVLLDVLRTVQVDSPPPDMEQPLTMLILPGPVDAPMCAAASGSR